MTLYLGPKANTDDLATQGDVGGTPPDWGSFYATSPIGPVASAAVTANTTYYARIMVLTAATLTGIEFFSLANTGTCRVSMYNSTGTRVANRTTNSSTLTIASQQVAFTSSYNATPGVYYIAVTFSSAVNMNMVVVNCGGSTAGPGSGATATSITPPTSPATVPGMSTY
jgi:hypothetical protein